MPVDKSGRQMTGNAVVECSRTQTCAIWFTGQRSRIAQRDRNRYVDESFAHPGKMLPDLVACILDTYGRPGDLWLDPMCGIGTTMVEALDRGYDACGLEWEARWFEVCRRNLDLAGARNPLRKGSVRREDARHLSQVLDGQQFEKIAFSPPYGNTLSKSAHGPDLHPERQEGGKRAVKAIRHGYGFTGTEEAAIPDAPGEMSIPSQHEVNIGDLKHGSVNEAISVVEAISSGKTSPKVAPTYLSEMARVYYECYQVLKPEAMMIVVLRDYRRVKKRVDLLGDTLRVCQTVGFQYHDRAVALQCPVEGLAEKIRARPEGVVAFWTLQNAKRANPPVMVPIFEDVLVVTKPK